MALPTQSTLDYCLWAKPQGLTHLRWLMLLGWKPVDGFCQRKWM